MLHKPPLCSDLFRIPERRVEEASARMMWLLFQNGIAKDDVATISVQQSYRSGSCGYCFWIRCLPYQHYGITTPAIRLAGALPKLC